MNIERFQPSAALQPFIREFIVIESTGEMANKTLPDTTMVLAIRYRGTVAKVEGNYQEIIPPSAISGLRKAARTHWYGGGTANLLVVFTEGGFSAFSRIPSHELFGVHISAENLFLPSELQEITERLAEAADHPNRITCIEGFLAGKLIHLRPDALVDQALRLIGQAQGTIRMRELAASLAISQDAFEKRFRNRIGCTPKQFAAIVRLRRVIRQYPNFSSLTEAAYHAGYFDQSHFIKDFRVFTGQAPKEFFQSPRFW